MSEPKTPQFRPLRPPQLKPANAALPTPPLDQGGEWQVSDEDDFGTDPYNTAAPFVAEHYRKS
jgi:hypothetical protein